MNIWNDAEQELLDQLLTEEEKQQMKQAAEDRILQKQEPMRPAYHFSAPNGSLNDPNGLCFWKGNWHMFYQSNHGSGWRWGHAVSTDLLRWRDLPIAITPQVEKECWSGMVLVEEERAIAVWYGLGSGIFIAVSHDPLLVRWEKLNGGEPVIPKADPSKDRYVAFDPCIWKNGDRYCLVSGKFELNPHTGTRVRTPFLFTSADLLHWEFQDASLLENDLYAGIDDDAACPYFVKCGDRRLFIHFSHHSGPKIAVGSYDESRDRFTVTGGMDLTSSSSFFGGLHAPAAFTDADGAVKAIFNVNHCKNPGADYQIMSLPWRISLDGHKGNDIFLEPAEQLTSLRVPESHTEEHGRFLPANEPYYPKACFGDTVELIAELEAKNVPMVEFKLLMSEDEEEFTAVRIFRVRGNTYLPAFGPGVSYRVGHETVVQLDATRSSRVGNVRIPDTQSFYLQPDEPIKARIFLDRTVVEVFVNGRVALTARVSPAAGNRGISITSRGDGLTLSKLESYELRL